MAKTNGRNIVKTTNLCFLVEFNINLVPQSANTNIPIFQSIREFLCSILKTVLGFFRMSGSSQK
jgi:hypothetical protein